MQLYQPTITGSLSVSGSINLSGSITIAGGGTISGTASIATNAITASSADNFLVRNTLTAQTLVVQTITSSVDFVTGSTRFGSLAANTHTFTGSVSISGSLDVNSGSLFVTGSSVGVNTNSPQSQFVVAAKTGNSASVEINLNNAGYGRIFAYNRSTVAAANLVLNDPGGNVLIGTTTDGGFKLDVSGTGRFSGSVTASGLKPQFIAEGGASSGAGIALNTSLSGTDRRNWFIGTEESVAGDFVIKSSTAAGGSGQSGNTRLTILSSGSIGIGTIPSAWTSPFTVIQGGSFGQHIGFQSNGPDIKVGTNNYYNGSNYIYTVSGNGAAQFNVGGNSGFQFNVAGSGTAGNAITFSSALNILPSGNVGIGTSSPDNKLQIHSAGSATDECAIRLRNPSGAFAPSTVGIYFQGGYTSDKEGVAAILGGRQTAANDSYLTFWTNPGGTTLSERMRITNAGNVLVNAGYVYINGEGNGVALDSGTASVARTGFMKYGGFEGMIVSGNTTKVRLCHRTDSDYVIGGTPTIREDLVIQTNGTVTIPGTLSKGGGSFKIDHPLPEKKDTHFLFHSFIEGPTPDLIYRGIATLVNGTATINIDEVSDMTEGTFVLLNKRVQCFTTNESGWDLIKGKVEGNILTITSQNPESTDEISWMVIGERHDEWMQNSDMTDENGKIIVEKEKPTIIE